MLDLYNAVAEVNTIHSEDHLKIAVVYFISSFMLSSNPKNTLISTFWFDLVDKNSDRNITQMKEELNVVDQRNHHDSSNHQ